MLLKGSIQLDDNEDITEAFVRLQIEGSKTLRLKASTMVVWLPSVFAGIPQSAHLHARDSVAEAQVL
jgi:hypothetical protein